MEEKSYIIQIFQLGRDQHAIVCKLSEEVCHRIDASQTHSSYVCHNWMQLNSLIQSNHIGVCLSNLFCSLMT